MIIGGALARGNKWYCATRAPMWECKMDKVFEHQIKQTRYALEQFFLTVGQNNFRNKIPFLIFSVHRGFLEH